MGTGYTTLRGARGAADGSGTESEKSRPIKSREACKDSGRRDKGDVAFARVFKIRSVK
jgi:hypothetical protein